MIRLVLFVLVGVLAGLGGGTGVSVLRAKKAFAAVQAWHAKQVADSLAEAQSGAAPEVHAARDSVAKDGVAKRDSSTATRRDSSGAHTAAAPPGRTPAVGGATPGSKESGTTTPVTAGAKPTQTGTSSTAPGPNHVETGAAKVGASQPAPAAARTTAVATPKVSPADSAAAAAQPKRIAKIFAAMAPKDAAKVLGQLDNADIQLILGSLGTKQAAAILTYFPPDRAAALSKAAMKPAKAP